MAARAIREQVEMARPGLTGEQVWRAVARASSVLLSHVTPGRGPRPSGPFRTCGFGVSLRAVVNPAAAQARVPVTPNGGTG